MVEDYLNKFMYFKKGTFPLIISTPHGGTLTCEEIPLRKKGISGIDKGTIQLTNKIVHLFESYNYKLKNQPWERPSLIISRIKRSYIDFNREEYEAYNPDSEIAGKLYRFYHEKINEFVSYNLNTFGISLLLDIHGFEKDKRPHGFRDVDIVLGTNNLKAIIDTSAPKKDINNNIRERIIREFLDLGVSIAPGHPKRREYALTGGYIVQTYGFNNIENSKAIQIEFSDKIRIFDKDLQKKVLVGLTQTILAYFSNILKNDTQ